MTEFLSLPQTQAYLIIVAAVVAFIGLVLNDARLERNQDREVWDSTGDDVMAMADTLHIERSPLAGRTAEAAAVHDPPTWKTKQHLIEAEIAALRRRLRNIETPTQQFRSIAADEGHPVGELGPAELPYERLVWSKDEPDWVQAPLPIRGLPARQGWVR